VIFGALPTDGWHGNKILGLSPDGKKLYVPIGESGLEAGCMPAG
jgi:hypothetical protein